MEQLIEPAQSAVVIAMCIHIAMMTIYLQTTPVAIELASQATQRQTRCSCKTMTDINKAMPGNKVDVNMHMSQKSVYAHNQFIISQLECGLSCQRVHGMEIGQ